MLEVVPFLPSFEALRGVLFFPSEKLVDFLPSRLSGNGQFSRDFAPEYGEVITLEVEGQPLAKARARTVRRGNFIATYDPQEKQKKEFREKLKVEWDRVSKIEMKASNLRYRALFWVDLYFELGCAKSVPNRQKMAKFWKLEGNESKPDLDNLEKYVLDCANGICFPDDSCIERLSSVKVYSENPKTTIRVTMIEKKDLHEPAEKIITMFSPTDFVQLVNEMRVLVKISEDASNVPPGAKLQAFCELAAHSLARIMDYPQLLKIAKVRYMLNEEEIRERKNVLYDRK
jgi:Holliday junction resolvase RusA-like endonuclease